MELHPRTSDFIKALDIQAAHEEKWAKVDFCTTQILGWTTIISSLATAILSAQGVSGISIACLAAIPGTILVIDRSFNFSRRARWHWEKLAAIRSFKYSLLYEAAELPVISKKYREYCIKMESAFPVLSLEKS